MIFREGYYYKYVGPNERQSIWSSEGHMDFVLDGDWHLCLSSAEDGSVAALDGCTFKRSREWCWGNSDFIETKFPLNEKLDKILKN
jgi:hypothetical protein